MTSQGRKDSAGETFREGVRSVAGVLGAVVETLEQTFADLRDSNELSPDRAREAARSTVRKAQETVEDLRDRLDFVTRREYEELRAEVRSLRAAVDALGGPPASPDEQGGASQATRPAEDAAAPDDGERTHGFPIDEG